MTKGALVDRLMSLVKDKTELLQTKITVSKAEHIHDFRRLEAKGYSEALTEYNHELLTILETVILEEAKAEQEQNARLQAVADRLSKGEEP